METNLNRKLFYSEFQKIMMPIEDKLMNDPSGLLKIGTAGTIYSERIRQAEGFLRLLWGYAGAYHNQKADPVFHELIKGISEGVDPESSGYWGDVDNYNQLMVEMAPLAAFILMNEDKVKKAMSEKSQKQMIDWLEQINTYEVTHNNWIFFRVLVNVCLMKCYSIDKSKEIEAELAEVDTFYLGNGWYCDGVKSQIDYYISFGMHYYSLLYVYFCKDSDKDRCSIFKDRAREFAKTFRYWFDAEGRGIPFGRSLTYRFAQSAFWAAALLADIEDFDNSEAKAILHRNLHNWLQQDIFSADGFLKVGYYYDDLLMAEEYNGPGSPYWAMKVFILLALDEKHPVWQLPESVQAKKPLIQISEADMLVETNEEMSIVKAFPTGQYVRRFNHGEAKYSKFVYSTVFGFNVSAGLTGWEKGGFDNTIAVSEQDDYYRVRTQTEKFHAAEKYTYSLWKPWKDATVESIVIPLGAWHIRIHHVKAKRPLSITDGGFSVPRNVAEFKVLDEKTQEIAIASDAGISAVLSLDGQMTAELSDKQVNQNLLNNCVVFPFLSMDCPADTDFIICNAFYGETNSQALNEPPEAEVTDEGVIIKNAGEACELLIKEMKGWKNGAGKLDKSNL